MTDTRSAAATLIAETPFPAAETMQCPFPYYAALRTGPPHRLPSGDFVISRRADILEITRNPEVFSNHHSYFDEGWLRPGTIERHRNPHGTWGLAVADRPDHTWKRKISFEMFKPGRLRRQEPMVTGIVDELIDGFIGRGECEFIGEFANRLTASVILTLFGLDRVEYLDRAMAWGRYEGFGTRWAAPENQAAARDAIVDLGAFIRERVYERVETPGEDELSLHVHRHIALRGELDIDNLVADATTLFVGGIITSAHLMGSMMKLFIQHPDQQAKARTDRSSLRRGIEESLRIESPTQIIPRLAVRDAEVSGVSIPAGSQVLLLFGAANRDESVFDCPENFDVERPNIKDHVAFGNGMHFCIGAPLARLEALVAYERIFARMHNLRFADGHDDPANDWTPIFRGPSEVHIEFDPVS